MHDDHDHAHTHPDHDHLSDHSDVVSAHQLLEQALRELLIEKGVLSAEMIARRIDALDSRSPALGAKVVARAWSDPAYEARLLADPRKALEEFGIDFGFIADLGVVKNTQGRHHVIVCTLCSCYPKGLLGIPPAWYKSNAYRQRTISDPRAVLAEFGTFLPEDTAITVVDSTADVRYIVLPVRPAGTEAWSEADLAGLVTRDSLIGVSAPLPASSRQP